MNSDDSEKAKYAADVFEKGVACFMAACAVIVSVFVCPILFRLWWD